MAPVKRMNWRAVLNPKIMMIVAALLAAAGFVAVYVEVHERIDRALALRQGPPQMVAIQSFNPGFHQGPVGEVYVRAEAGFDRAVMIRLPDGSIAKRALVIPLYELSDQDAVITEPNVAVMGLLYHPIQPGMPEPTDPRAFANEVFGPGLNGTKIEVNGLLADRKDFEPLAQAAFNELGVVVTDSVLGIQPFAGRRTIVLGSRPAPRLIQALFIGSLGLFAAAAAIAFRAPAPGHTGDGDADDPDAHAAPAFHPMFAPIPTQGEIAAEERARLGPDDLGWKSRSAKAALTGVGSLRRIAKTAASGAGKQSKNRPSRPEDEAL